MFDFPANPAIGDASNGYIFNGVGWAGGPIASTPTEQFFDLSGLTTKDVVVPAWAKHVEIEGCVYISVGTVAPIVQISADGTTFLAGAANYAYGGSVLNSGTGAHQQVPTNTTMGLWLSFLGDNATGAMPHLFTADLQLVRGNSSPNLFTMKSYAKSYDSAAANLYRSSFIHAYVAAAATTALAIKALRFTLNAAGSFNPGSWIKVKWLGAASDIPQSNAVGEAPQTGKTFGRRNSAWIDILGVVPPMPQTTDAAALGYYIAITGNTGAAIALPAGGTWLHFSFGYNPGSGSFPYGITGGIAPGGSQIRAATASIAWSYVAWRLT
jgi:hypothetical protein